VSFGVTNEGFKAKRLEDIREETLISWRQKFGEWFSIPDDSPEGQVKGILDERLSLIWELAEEVASSYIPSQAVKAQLDNVLQINGLTRIGETNSIVNSGRARGVFGTSIPFGTVISVLGNSSSRFVTNATFLINNAAIDEVQEIAFSAAQTSSRSPVVIGVPAWTPTAAIASATSFPHTVFVLSAILYLQKSFKFRLN